MAKTFSIFIIEIGIMRVITLQIALPLVLGILLYYIPHQAHASLIRNHVPDGLWAFALVNALYLIWNYRMPRLWLVLAMLLFIAFEALQYLNIIGGTGDMKDLFTYILFTLFSFLINKHHLKNETISETSAVGHHN